MVVSADVYRPAAIKQLEALAEQVDAIFHPSSADEKPVDIAKGAIDAAKKQFVDVVLVDTAGRLHIDDDMMNEIQGLHKAVKPVETLFVIDAMIGQDAVNTAQAFNEALPLTGVIITKVDGDARGGAALSVRHVTGKPIKFLGVGEKVDALEPFYPDRIASRILGMGDVLSLIEEAEQKIDKKKADRLARKFKKGKAFDFEDLRDQLQQMNNMGGMASMFEKLPGVNAQMTQALESDETLKQFARMEAMINSMTPQERRRPELVMNMGSRKKRITQGSGTTIQDLNRLIKQQKQMAKMMKKMKSRKGMMNMMRGLEGQIGGPGGGMPPGGLPPGFK
jgi:signal recognition particle subunit SRP54